MLYRLENWVSSFKISEGTKYQVQGPWSIITHELSIVATSTIGGHLSRQVSKFGVT
jgi:hypothetical protein